jgi:hypothetical protein
MVHRVSAAVPVHTAHRTDEADEVEGVRCSASLGGDESLDTARVGEEAEAAADRATVAANGSCSYTVVVRRWEEARGGVVRSYVLEKEADFR